MTGDPPLVSIVTPSFNKGPYIEETIQSIKNQSYPNIEHIVIDGGSTDGTLEILKKYEGNLFWISEPDHGQSDAINKGWRRARGDIIAYLNADDTYLPDAVATAVRYFAEHPDVGMVYGDGIFTDETGKCIRTYHAGEFSMRELIYCRNNILQPALFLRRSVYEKIGGIDENLHLAMDLDYWIRAGLLFRIAYIPIPLATAKIYGNAKSSALMFRYVHDYEYILGKLYASDNLSLEILGYRQSASCFIFTKGGLDYLHALMPKEGVRYLWKGFRINPLNCVQTMGKLLCQYIRNMPVKSGGS